MPIIAIFLCKKYSFLEKISPLSLCYAFGMVISQFPNFINSEIATGFAKIAVAYAIPLMLLATNLNDLFQTLGKSLILSILFFLLVSLLATSAGIIYSQSNPNAYIIAGMLTGTYVGSAPNLAAVGTTLNAPNELFVMTQTVDLLVSGVLFLFMITLGPKVLSKFLITPNKNDDFFHHDGFEERLTIKDVIKALAVTTIILAACLGISKLLPNTIEQFAIFFLLSFLSLWATKFKFVEKINGSYYLGEIIFLVFCVAVGSMTNLSKIAQIDSGLFLIATIIVFGSVSIYMMFCKFFKIPRDTAIITSMAGIFSPAMIGALIAPLGNRKLLAPAMAAALLSLALGNLLGLSVAKVILAISTP